MRIENATQIFDGKVWYYNIEPGSIRVNRDQGLVSFTVHWQRTARKARITLRLDQVQGIQEPV